MSVVLDLVDAVMGSIRSHLRDVFMLIFGLVVVVVVEIRAMLRGDDEDG